MREEFIDSDSAIAGGASKAPCSQIVCNFIFACKYVFLVRCVAGGGKKTGTQTALTSNYTPQLVWDEIW